jgi:hypothetical protein
VYSIDMATKQQIEERIRRNREMEARIAAQREAARPALEAKARRRIARLCVNFVRSLPIEDQRPVAKQMIKIMRPDVAERLGF